MRALLFFFLEPLGGWNFIEGGPHAPEESAPPPTVGFRVNIDGLVQIPEVTLSLVVGKEMQQAKKISMNAPGRGDYARRKARRIPDDDDVYTQ